MDFATTGNCSTRESGCSCNIDHADRPKPVLREGAQVGHYRRIRIGDRMITAETVHAVVAEIVEESSFCLQNGRNPLAVVAKRWGMTAHEVAVIAGKALEAFEYGSRVQKLYGAIVDRKAFLARRQAFEGAA